ncbi:hypothetical protein C6501_08180 [Candidatus Poribacteria bacterium]|nr:MAG: hypothetical protein C6501_08180 [Candidatus Poribacteria bacterium]
MATKHDKTAQHIANQKGTDYNKGPGPDIKTSRQTIEVESTNTIGDAGCQLQGHRGPVYVAVTDDKDIPKAVDRYGGTTIGVMDSSGKVVKPSSRKR